MVTYPHTLKDLERLAFYALVFLLPFQVRLIIARFTESFNEWTLGSVYVTDFLLIFILLLLLVRLVRGHAQIKYGLFEGLFDAFLLVSIISAFFATIPSLAWYRVAELVLLAFFFFYVRHSVGEIITWRSLTKVIGLSALVQALVGIAQSLLQARVGLSWLGESPLVIGNPGIAVFEVSDRLFLRAYGLTPHPNVLAAWLLLGLVCLGVLFCQSRAWGKRYGYLTGFVLVLYGLLYTFSRTAILVAALTVASLVAFIVFSKHIRSCYQVHKQSVWVLFACIVCVGVIFTGSYWAQVQTRIHIDRNEEAVTQRLFFADLAEKITKEKPTFGVGIGQFVPRLMEKYPNYDAYLYQPAHNVFLLVASEQGIFGAVIFGGLVLFGVLRMVWRSRVRSISSVLLVGVGVGFLVMGFFDHFFITLQQGTLMWWGLFALLSVKDVDKVPW